MKFPFNLQGPNVPEVYVTTPSGRGGGIWQAGIGLLWSAPNVYFSTGNGTADGSNFADSVVALHGDSLTLATTPFTPANAAVLEQSDMDVSSTGPIALYQNIVQGGKEGVLYNLDAANLQPIQPAFQATANQYRTINGHPNCLPRLAKNLGSRADFPHIHGGLVFNSVILDSGPGVGAVYVWGEKDFPRKYPLTVDFSNPNRVFGKFLNVTPRANWVTYCDDEACSINCASSAMDPNAEPTDNFLGADNVPGTVRAANGMSGGVLTLSGTFDASLLWGSVNLNGDAELDYQFGSLFALNAKSMATIWSNAGDTYIMAKFAAPTVSNGRVYLPALVYTPGAAQRTNGDSQIYIYGWTPPSCAATSSCANGTPCNSGTQCGSLNCNITCQPPTCTGTGCGLGQPCGANSDCKTSQCVSSRCAPATCAPNCNDKSACGNNADCGSKVCSVNTSWACQPPACASTHPLCNQGAPCGANADCGSLVCTAGTCRAPACAPSCRRGQPCNNNGDCSSHVCTTSQTCK
jgi:hypothetical protein